MHPFKRKRLIRSIIFSHATVAVLCVLVVLLSFSVFERFTVEREMEARRAAVEEELQELRLRAATLESEVEYLQDERGIEAEIRDRFDVVKEGEQVVIILDDAGTSSKPLLAPPPPPDEPWYKFW